MIFIATLACAPKPKIVEKPPAPYDLKADTSSRKAILYWRVDEGKTAAIFGYDIYLTEKSLQGSFANWEKDHPAPYNSTPYPGDTDGDRSRESIEITGLENGHTYYASVRTLGKGGLESNPSNEIEFTPLASGEFVISSNHSAENGGFNFENETSVPARDLRCDLYLYAKGDTVGLSSPNRLGAGLRQTWFGRPGIYYIRPLDSIRIAAGEKIFVTGTFGRAEMTVKKIEFRGPNDAQARLKYVFYPPGSERQ